MIVDDHALVRKGLCELFSNQDDMSVIATAANGLEAFSMINSGLCVDVVLTDLKMPVMGGMELTKKLATNNYPCRVVVLTSYASDILKQHAIYAGASNCLDKSGDFETLVTAIRNAYFAVKFRAF